MKIFPEIIENRPSLTEYFQTFGFSAGKVCAGEALTRASCALGLKKQPEIIEDRLSLMEYFQTPRARPGKWASPRETLCHACAPSQRPGIDRTADRSRFLCTWGEIARVLDFVNRLPARMLPLAAVLYESYSGNSAQAGALSMPVCFCSWGVWVIAQERRCARCAGWFECACDCRRACSPQDSHGTPMGRQSCRGHVTQHTAQAREQQGRFSNAGADRFWSVADAAARGFAGGRGALLRP